MFYIQISSAISINGFRTYPFRSVLGYHLSAPYALICLVTQHPKNSAWKLFFISPQFFASTSPLNSLFQRNLCTLIESFWGTAHKCYPYLLLAQVRAHLSRRSNSKSIQKNVRSGKKGIRFFYDETRSVTLYSNSSANIEAWAICLSQFLNQLGFH